jgi:ectoine hydroxylase-related dioxygenase (phytanoyl-CoA dioxygenase family)
MAHRLSAEQVQDYRKNGFLLIDESVFPPEKFAAFSAHFEMHLKTWAEVMGGPVEVIDRAHFIDPKLNDWLLAPEVLDLVEPLIGPDIALFASSCINKLDVVGKRVPWHEDGSYWKPLTENRIEVATVWLAVDPSTTENGCMRVIPGSHRERDRAHEQVSDVSEVLLNKTVREELFDAATAVDCVLKPNQCSLHDAYLIHGSSGTTGKARRCGYQMRYMPTTVKSSDYQGQQVYLARGVDRAGNAYADPTRVNEKWVEDNAALQRIARMCAASEVGLCP